MTDLFDFIEIMTGKSKLRILYVEDENTTRRLMTKLLEREGMTVYDAPDGSEGFALFHELKPDIIITNLSMPILNGFEMINRIRQTDKETPIIVISGFRQDSISLPEYVNEFIMKPVLRSDLMDILNRYSCILPKS